MPTADALTTCPPGHQCQKPNTEHGEPARRASDEITIYRVDSGFVVADLGGWLDGVYPTRAAALAAAEK